MPTFKYRCTRDHETEVTQGITEQPLVRCPEPKCPAPCKRVPFTGKDTPGFTLKGAGWYRDGYTR